MENKPPENNNDKLYIIVAIAFAALGAVALGVAFTKLGGYALIACMILEVVAATLINLQQKKENFKWLLYFKIGVYLLFAAAVILLITGVVNL